jgi:hypothetical protein
MAPWTPERFAAEVVGSERSIRARVIARAQEQGLSKSFAEDPNRLAAEAHVFFYQNFPAK